MGGPVCVLGGIQVVQVVVLGMHCGVSGENQVEDP